MKMYVVRGKIVALGILLLIAAVCSVGGIRSVFKVGGRELPIYSVERTDNHAALTFNCAWNADDIDSILDTLDNFSVKATFFMVGDWAERFPDAVKKICEHGHELANHSYNHSHYSKMTREEILTDIERCDAVLKELTGKEVRLVRPAYGEYDDKTVLACEESGRFCIQWSVDSLDYGDASAQDIFKRVVAKTRCGDIVLMHNGTKNTAAVLPEILSELTKSLELCTVSELIYTDGYTVDHTGRQWKV